MIPGLTPASALAYSHGSMRRLGLPLLALATWVPLAWGQPAPTAVGTVTKVEGLVTMSFGSQVATVQPGTPIFDGARLVSSSTGTGVLQLRLEGGCTLNLAPNQMVTVGSSLTCSQQVAAIVTLPGSAVAGGGFAGGGAFAQVALPLLGAGALAAALARSPVSETAITPRPQ